MAEVCFMVLLMSLVIVSSSVQSSPQLPHRDVLLKVTSRLPPGTHLLGNENLPKDLQCEVCQIATTYLKMWFEEGRTQLDIIQLVISLCKDLKLNSDRICDLWMWEFKDEIFGVMERTVLTPDEVCGVIVGPPCGAPYNPDQMWNVSFPSTPKPPVHPPKPPAPSAPKLRFLQLTDMHRDLMYETGATAKCGEPLCCRSNDGPPETPSAAAGRWGDTRMCDLPGNMEAALFQHLRSIQDQFDFIIFTGDIPAHDTWNQTRTQQVAATRRLTKLFHQNLPDKRVFFCAGNHESVPVDSFPPPEVTGNNSISWLYTVFAETWSTWLPPDTKQTILKGGYYTVSPYPGFRIVSVNSNYCNLHNWWLLVNATDPADELQWLIDVLQQAEDSKEKVLIISHLPPGKRECVKPWSWNFYKIINRYESTITGLLYGHTHKDEFEVFYDDVNFKRPIDIAYVMGSVATRGGVNPGYRIYTMDGNYSNSSWEILDYNTYIVDMEEANKQTTPPVWSLEYSPKTEYNMTGLYPQDWSDLIYRMKQDDNLFQTFNRLYYKMVDHGACTGSCKTEMLCGLKSGRSYDPDLCRDIQS